MSTTASASAFAAYAPDVEQILGDDALHVPTLTRPSAGRSPLAQIKRLSPHRA